MSVAPLHPLASQGVSGSYGEKTGLRLVVRIKYTRDSDKSDPVSY